MAHYMKFKMSDIHGILKHDNRTMKNPTENIDDSRSHLNYNLCQNDDLYYFYKRLEQAKAEGATVRKDSVLMYSIIVTLPENFPNSEFLEKQFFISVYEFLEKEFGKENVVSAWVHNDETKKKDNNKLNKGHIHFNGMPIEKTIKKYKDGTEKERLRFNANRIITREYLQTFHKRLSDYVEEALGFKTDILNGATIEGNKTIKELKKITEEDKKVKEYINGQPALIEADRKRIINEYWQEYKNLSSEYWQTYKTKKENIKNDLWELKRGIYGTEKQIERDLDFISNLSRGLLFALIRFVGGLILFSRKRELENNLKTIQSNFERLEKARRSISNYQENTKIKLKREDIEEIENAMIKWEKSIIDINENIRDELFERHEIERGEVIEKGR